MCKLRFELNYKLKTIHTALIMQPSFNLNLLWPCATFAGHSSAALVTIGPCAFNDMQCCSHDALTIVGCSKYKC